MAIQNVNIGLSAPAASSGCGCGSCSCGAGNSAAASAAHASALTSVEIGVDGMTCSHCVASVREELSELEGVESVDVILKNGGTSRVTIHSSAPLPTTSVRAAIEDAGYRLVTTLS